jgi:hypothetical protein
LCLDGGVEDLDKPLRRECACRGTDAGFVHLSCLAKYAASISLQAHTAKEAIKPWEICPGCHQKYQHQLRIDITTEFVSFIRKQYPRDTQKQVEALHLKLCAFDSMFYMLQPVQKREAGVTANVILSLIDRMKGDASLSERDSRLEVNVYSILGRITFDEGRTEEGARRAVAYYEKALKLSESIGDVQSIATTKSNIIVAKSKFGGVNTEEILKNFQDMYEGRVAELGEESEHTIRAGEGYAINLQNADRWGEARELLTKLLATSKQVFGADHNITKSVEAAAKRNHPYTVMIMAALCKKHGKDFFAK